MEFYDTVQTKLFEQRTVFISGVLDDKAAGDAAAQLMTLDATGDSSVTLVLDAAGTSLDAAFTVMDVIDLLGVPVHCVCVGRAEGPAVGVLAVCERRIMAPHARLRLRDPDAEANGTAADMVRWAEYHQTALARFCRRVADAAKQPVDRVAEDCTQGRYLDADEAVAYGLADEVAGNDAAIIRWPGFRMGFRPPTG
jgi:ATP-dependent Clp protease protease subunit